MTRPNLTRREAEIAALCVAGLGAQAIAARLGTTRGTVRNQLRAIYKKMGCATAQPYHSQIELMNRLHALKNERARQ